MTKLTATLAAAALAVALVGCGGGNSQDQASHQNMDRDSVIASMQHQLDKVGDKLDQLQARIASSTGEAKQNLQDTYDSLTARQHELDKQIAELKTNSNQTWDNVHDSLQRSLDEFSARVDRAWDDLTTKS